MWKKGIFLLNVNRADGGPVKSASIALGEERKKGDHPFLGGSRAGNSAPIWCSSLENYSLTSMSMTFFSVVIGVGIGCKIGAVAKYAKAM